MQMTMHPRREDINTEVSMAEFPLNVLVEIYLPVVMVQFHSATANQKHEIKIITIFMM